MVRVTILSSVQPCVELGRLVASQEEHCRNFVLLLLARRARASRMAGRGCANGIVLHNAYHRRRTRATGTHQVPSAASPIFLMNTHDCTFKESLYSTHPYLTFSNKSQLQPVMTTKSTLGYREKIGFLFYHRTVAVATSSAEESFPLYA